MSIRPIDMQSATTRASDISKMREHEGKNPENLQDQFATQLEKEVDVEISTVYEAQKDEKMNLDPEREGDGTGEERKSKKEKSKKETKKDIPAAYRDGGSLVDIEV